MKLPLSAFMSSLSCVARISFIVHLPNANNPQYHFYSFHKSILLQISFH